MARQVKVMDFGGHCHLEVIHFLDGADQKPYRIRRVVEGTRRIQIAKVSDWMSVLRLMYFFYSEGIDTLTTPEMKEWFERSEKR